MGWDDGSSRHAPGFGLAAPSEAGPDHPRLIVDGSDAHALVCAPTGTGKGRSFAIPALLSWTGGVIAVDPKGELYGVTARHRRTLGPVLAIDPFHDATNGKGAFNPLSNLDPKAPGFIDDVYALASLFASDVPATGQDGRFWEDWGNDVIAGLTAHVAWCETETDRSFGRVYELLHQDDLVYSLAVLLDTTGKHPFTVSTIGSWLQLPEVTRGGVISSFLQQTRMLASPAVRASLSGNSFDPAIIQSGKPFTVYLIWPADKLVSHAVLLRVFLTGLTNLLMRRRRKPKRPTLMLIDEAAQIGRVPALVSATTLGRGYGIRIAWLFQSYAQMRKTYPQEHEAIMENCGTVLTFGRHSSFSMSRTLSEMAFGDVSADTLFALGRDQVMLRRSGELSKVARKLDYLRDAPYRGRYDPNRLHMPMR
ncbi:type IV secretory system conjugative DNA transfer family protein [Jiella pacifica]|mgnify:CR=1 FL=1|uniref:Type IV secretory system conjugative DNA transfer family protein n=1 Tax=Jiella pacifica TaxID=2696469 RepID=A0A6N9TC60_9HYPH|nr:type IV secretory system conjugative DNA transfer family protein [Jiella pacifica]NDW07815.1 type IV secretory system conjugative DNA transfer family protein [Jiella pacifica]